MFFFKLSNQFFFLNLMCKIIGTPSNYKNYQSEIENKILLNIVPLHQGCPIMCHGGPRVRRFSFQPITTPADFTNEHIFNQRIRNQLVKSVGVMIGWNENLHTLGPPWQRLNFPALHESMRHWCPECMQVFISTNHFTSWLEGKPAYTQPCMAHNWAPLL